VAATILCIRATPALAEATRLLLEQHAYEIVTATDFKQVEAACTNIRFDLALIGDNFDPRIKKAIYLLIKENCAKVPILEMYKGNPAIDNAEHVNAASPDELILAVRRMLA
jgi:DNA-binding response OmpR family regulator